MASAAAAVSTKRRCSINHTIKSRMLTHTHSIVGC